MQIEKVEKLATNLYDKKYAIHMKKIEQMLNHGLKLKKVHWVIEFNQKAWLKPYIVMNTELRKKEKYDFKKEFFELLNN